MRVRNRDPFSFVSLVVAPAVAVSSLALPRDLNVVIDKIVNAVTGKFRICEQDQQRGFPFVSLKLRDRSRVDALIFKAGSNRFPRLRERMDETKTLRHHQLSSQAECLRRGSKRVTP